MSQQIMLKARGLYTHPNALSEVPEGSLVVADNVVIDRNGVIEPRRGLAQYGDTFGTGADTAKQLLTYKNRILRHYDDVLQFDDGTGDFDDFYGDYSEPVAGLRMKYVEANGNLYFTSSEGVKKISATAANDFTTSAGFIRDVGAPRGLDVTGVVNYDTTGFFTDTSKVAYRIVWGYTDDNQNLVLGFPSAPIEITNFSDSLTGTVDLTFAIPTEIGTSSTEYFYQVYRTAVTQAPTVPDLADISAGDEMYLVVEDFPSSGELSAGIVTLTDITPETFRVNGALLYSNGVSGEGIQQGNYRPPIARDIALFQESMFYAYTESIQRLELDLLSVSLLTSGTSTFTITDGTATNTYTFRGVREKTAVTFDTKANTTASGYFLLSSANDSRQYYVWANKTGSDTEPSALDTVGRLGIEVDLSAAVTAASVATAVATAVVATGDFTSSILSATATFTAANNGPATNATNGTTGFGGGAFAISVTQQGTGEDASTKKILLSGALTPAQQIDETARSIVTVINQNSSEIVNAYYNSSSTTVPGLIQLEQRNLSGAAFWVYADSTNTGSQFSPSLPATNTGTVISSNEIEPNAVYFSKYQEPEAVPLVNKFKVGPKDKAILRILPLRNGLFILKEDGIYRLTGTNGSFSVDPFDNSAILIAPDSAVVLNNQIYMLSSQGVVTISDTGVSVISRPIEDKLRKITSNDYDFQYPSFGVSYETDRAYLLWTVSSSNDTVATQCYRYNTFTNSWTRFPIAKTCGVVNPSDDTLYLGAADENFIERERKSFDRSDYADRQIDLALGPNAIGDETLILSSTTDVDVGDVLIQTQYLSPYLFNQLLKKLDLDPGVADTDYYSSLVFAAGDHFRTKLDDLASKLDADTGITATTFLSGISAGTDFEDYQDDFNVITALLNADPTVIFGNYKTSTGTRDVEVIVTAVSNSTNTATVQFNLDYVQGPIIVFKGISSTVQWAPQHFGDASIQKHVREGTVLFENSVFFGASVGYSSDLSPGFERTSFTKTGIGDWGGFIWSEQNWGGEGNATPLRTYIPRDKQRCRYLNCQFVHESAREKFSLYGISLTFRPLSERAYRR